ncbi:B12-binding domain-containing radical SAM protein [Pelagibacteraceae bacterium]|nr:B12-binding domain-containing radical SAM protein [Pelagibacteraceae bacterium]
MNLLPIKSKKNYGPSTEELIERGFDPKNGKVDVLLIHPPSTIAERYGKDDMGEFGGDLIPLGIASLAGYLREKGFGVGILDCPALRIDSEKVYEVIKNKNPSIIGFSTTTYSLARAVEIGKIIRKKLPNKLTIVGGSHANVAGIETANKYDIFDIIAYGLDGEHIMNNIAENYSQKNFNREAFLSDFKMLEQIKGIIYKKNNVVMRNTPSEIINDLDELPLPARDLFPMERYIPVPHHYKKLPLTNMVVIRGCPYFCTFCDQAGTKTRRRSPQKVIDEIKHCVDKYGIKEISFWDDTLSYHKKWMKEFLDLLMKAELDIVWSCFAAVNTVDEEILNLMGKAGCWNIFYGYETGVEILAKNMLTHRKNRDFDKMKKVAKWTKNAGIEVIGSFVIGLPGETPELARQTIQNAIELDPDYVQFAIACPYPGTQLAKEIKQGKWGKFVSDELEEYTTESVTWLPSGYSSVKELEDMQRYAFRKFYLRPSYIFKRILKLRSLEDLKRHVKGAVGLVKAFI